MNNNTVCYLFFFCLDLCNKTNILTSINLYNLTSHSALFSDFSNIYEDMKGENLTQAPYIINFNFNNHICVSEVDIQTQTTRYKDFNSNVAKIEVSYTTPNGSDVFTSNGEKLLLQSPDNNPTIYEQPMRCNIQGIKLQILNITNQKQPSNVRVRVLGCYAPGKLFFYLTKIKYFL